MVKLVKQVGVPCKGQLHKTGEFFVGQFLWLFFVVKSVFLVDLMMSI